jgi:hypothetical protein
VPLPLLRRLRTPFLTTLHGRLDLPDLPLTAQRFPDAPFVSISRSQRAALPGINWLATIQHELPPDLLKLCDRTEGYLAFLGRISPEKGPDIAIHVAHAPGLPLRIAARDGFLVVLLEGGGEALDQCVPIERLAEIANRAGGQHLRANPLVGEGRDEDNGHTASLCDQETLQLYTTHARHFNVRDDAGGLLNAP